jgi:hypothetical protein
LLLPLVKDDSDGRQWWSCAMPRRRGDGINLETSWRMRLVRPGNFEYQVTIGHRIDDVLDSLRCSQQTGIKGGHSLVLLHDLLTFSRIPMMASHTLPRGLSSIWANTPSSRST